jgi:hypothetical protein
MGLRRVGCGDGEGKGKGKGRVLLMINDVRIIPKSIC